MDITKSKKDQPKLTDFQTFWKIITLVCVSIIAEALIIWAATSDLAVDWTYTTVVTRRHPITTEVVEAEAAEETNTSATKTANTEKTPVTNKNTETAE